MIDNTIAFDFDDDYDVTVDNHAGLVIDNAVTIDYNNDVSLVIDNAFDFTLVDEEFASETVDSNNMIDIKPCEVSYDNDGM